MEACDVVLRDLIEQYISIFLYDNAKFYAERLYYNNPLPEHLFLLARCYYGMGKIKQVYHLLREDTYPPNRYLFAKSCISLDMHSEAERALIPIGNVHPDKLSEEQALSIPGGAGGLYLLGLVCRREQRKDHAVSYFTRALKLDQMCWCAYTELCEMGVEVDAEKVFGVPLKDAFGEVRASQPPVSLASTAQGPTTHSTKGNDMERRRMAENIHDTRNSPHTAASLGLSSLALRVGFATPGSMPHTSALSGLRQMSLLSTSMLRPSSAVSHGQQPPLSAMGGASCRTGFPLSTGPVAAGRLFGTPDSGIGSSMEPLSTNHAPGLGFDTPGLTPIASRRLSAGSSYIHTHGEDGEGYHMAMDAARRRVSFGPTVVNSRLSFASTCIAEEEEPLEQTEHDISDEEAVDSFGSDDPPPKLQKTRLSLDSRDGAPTHSRTPVSPSRTSRGEAQQRDRPVTRSRIPRASLGERGNVTKDSLQGDLPHSPPSTRKSQLSPPRTRSRDKDASTAASTSASGTKGTARKSRGTGTAANEPVQSSHQAILEENAINEARELYKSGTNVVLSYLAVFGHAYRLLCAFKCMDCIRHLQQLPRRHYSSGWVQHALGKAYFELNDYKASQLALREMLRLEPFRVAGTEILSTALWHLKRDKELCSLAQQVAEIDKLSPETWCVVGNCFSLQREHEAAIKFFDRAIQLDKSFTYAHTLNGHEYVCNEDLDKAMEAFRKAVYYDDRHYNAWYGLGTIYFRQERLELAEYHFRRAVDINPTSSVLQCYLGMVLNSHNRMEKNLESIDLLSKACRADNRNPQVYFQLAHVLLSNGSHRCLQEAVNALKVVKEFAPKEPAVYALMGQVCYKLGWKDDALRNFNSAIDLDHKQAAILKPTLDLIQDPYMAGVNEDVDMMGML